MERGLVNQLPRPNHDMIFGRYTQLKRGDLSIKADQHRRRCQPVKYSWTKVEIHALLRRTLYNDDPLFIVRETDLIADPQGANRTIGDYEAPPLPGRDGQRVRRRNRTAVAHLVDRRDGEAGRLDVVVEGNTRQNNNLWTGSMDLEFDGRHLANGGRAEVYFDRLDADRQRMGAGVSDCAHLCRRSIRVQTSVRSGLPSGAVTGTEAKREQEHKTTGWNLHQRDFLSTLFRVCLWHDTNSDARLPVRRGSGPPPHKRRCRRRRDYSSQISSTRRTES